MFGKWTACLTSLLKSGMRLPSSTHSAENRRIASPTPAFAFADELERSGQHCATIARAKTQDFFRRGFVPEIDDPTATVTFILFEGKTYAVTAGHVIDIFKAAAVDDGCDPEGYFVPVAPGVSIGPPFVRPPG